MKYLLFPVFLLTTISMTQAQTVSDALRYSRIQNYGTARMSGVGGAFSALGADFGAVSLNPAGLAMYRSNEFMFTPGFYFSSTNAKMDVNNAVSYSDETGKMRFANMGLVFNTTNTSKNSKWKTFNVGIGYNQLSNFNQKINYEGTANGTILNNWFDTAAPFLAGGGNPDDLYPLGEGLAYKSGAIYTQNGLPAYDFIGSEQVPSNRSHTVTSRGSNSELAMSFAGNYEDKLMIGGSLGVPIISYRQEALYTEADPNGGYGGNVTYFDNLAYSDYVRTNGVGFNAKLGATFRVNQMFRIGGAFHSPSFLNLTDNFNASMTYAYQDQDAQGNILDYSADASAAAEPFNYRLRTPWRGVFGAAVLLKTHGFLSADIEYTDYSASHFNLTKTLNDADTKAYERDLNADIQRNLQPAMNYKFGAEIVLDMFRLRGGYSLLGKPQKSATGFNSAVSVGAGIRWSKFYLDLAVRHSNTTGSVNPYSGSDAPKANTESTVNDILLTAGFKF